MKSKIDITEFRNRLKENTKVGSPSLKIPLGFLSIFTDNSKCFYGNFDNSTFRLTRNYSFMPTFYLIKGNYKNTANKLLVNFSVEPAGKIRMYWIKYFPIFAIIMFNSIFYFLLNPPVEIYFIFNAFIVFVSLVSRLNLKWQNKALERKFKKVFEIMD